MRSWVLLVGLVVFLALGVSAPGGEPPAEKFARYLGWHDVCLKGDTGAIDAEIARFERILKRDPGDSLARAFLGSACALRAKAGIWGPTKLKFLRRGEKHIEAAVASAPSDPRVRMIRAIAYARIPKRFKKRSTALADFRILIPMAREGRHGLVPGERQAILFHASRLYDEEKVAGASELRAHCHRIDPSSEFGKASKGH